MSMAMTETDTRKGFIEVRDMATSKATDVPRQ